MHKNNFTFKANTHYDLGLLLGTTFKDQAQKALKENHDQDWDERVTNAKKLLAETQYYFPQYIQELEGYAHGAELDFLDFWTLSLEDDALISQNENKAKCTTIITNNGRLIGHNEDAVGQDLEDTVCIVKKQINNFVSLEIFYYNTLGGSSIGINSFGFCQTINTLFFTPRQVGIPKNILARHFFDTGNPQASLDYVINLQRASGYNHNLTNINGKIQNFEITADKVAVSYPQSPYVHTNHCCLENDLNFVDDKYGTMSRYKMAHSLIKSRMSSEEMIDILGTKNQGKDKSIENERTIAKMIVDLENRIAKIWLKREQELGWVNYSLDFLDVK